MIQRILAAFSEDDVNLVSSRTTRSPAISHPSVIRLWLIP